MTNLYHSEFKLDWFKKFKVAPEVIFDVGSYDGGDAKRYKETFPHARVVACEADPVRSFHIHKNLANTDIEILQYAVGDTNGVVPWYSAKFEGRSGSQGSMFKVKDPERIRGLQQAGLPSQVTSRRLDTICFDLGIKKIDYLHIDAEGAELLILKGLGELRPKLIFLEVLDYWVGAPSTTEVLTWLKDNGYSEVASLDHNRLFKLWTSSEES